MTEIKNLDLTFFEQKDTYCMGKDCKKATKSKSLSLLLETTSKGDRYRLSMKCVNCGKNKSSFVSKESVKQILISDGGRKNDNNTPGGGET